MIQENNKIKAKSGIYLLLSQVNEKRYVGSSIDLFRRIYTEHKRQLEKGVHDNPHLQNHVNKYGVHDLQVIILKLCPPADLLHQAHIPCPSLRYR